MVNLHEKLSILAKAAKYDVSCSSSGSTRKNTPNGIGNAAESGICHSFTSDGRCISLLKILLTNDCIFDCAYCVNRCSNDIPRASFTPDEVAELTINFYKRNYIEGLFLSSAVHKNPNYTMELLIKTAELLRYTYNFNGYIHLKAIPGAAPELIKKAGILTDRMSVNIELPSQSSLKLLAPQKHKDTILKPMSQITEEIKASAYERRYYKNAPSFVPAGQSTQLIVGATPDSDLKILRLSQGLYNKFNLKRVYYSAYVPVVVSPKLPALLKPPLLREHRLYQADWLLRFYGFNAEELLDEKNPNFDENFDPKTQWALNHLENFPVEINRAPREMLLRVPGIGVRSLSRILAARVMGSLCYEDLKKLGVVLKRAKYFITCNGSYSGDVNFDALLIRQRLAPLEKKALPSPPSFEQLSFLSLSPGLYLPGDAKSSVTGEL